jgi:hypothetical protein
VLSMRTWRRLIGSLVVAAGSVVVIAMVRDGAVDVVDGAVLVIALLVLARTAIRLASDPDRLRR